MTKSYEDYKQELGDFLPSKSQLIKLEKVALKEIEELKIKHTLLSGEIIDFRAELKTIEALKGLLK